MKKFFKILRKIIKIFFKIIFRLILGIIIISGITLVIINNRTLKFYYDDNNDPKFTMKESFIIEKGIEIKISLNEGSFSSLTKNIDDEEYLNHFKLKINLPSISFVKNFYKQGYIKNFIEILPYCFDGNIISFYDNLQIFKIGQSIKNGNSYDANYKEFYENGQIKREDIEYFYDGIHYALFTGYLKNGTVEYNGYVEGLKNVGNNTWTGYFKNGTVNYVNHYSGYNITYYENGNIFYEGYSKYGKLDGIVTGYYINGNIVEISNYDGNGNYYNTFYNQDGTIFGTGNQDEGSKISIHKNGQIELILSSDGIGTGYYENGNIAFIGNYSTGALVINGTEYSNEGYILTTYDYDGNGNGYRIYYDQNGDILGTGEYIDDEIINGLYIHYSNKNGQILENGNYIDGNKDGYRIEYFEDGKIYSEGIYDNGKRVGVWNRYLGDGSIGVSKDYGGNEKINN